MSIETIKRTFPKFVIVTEPATDRNERFNSQFARALLSSATSLDESGDFKNTQML